MEIDGKEVNEINLLHTTDASIWTAQFMDYFQNDWNGKLDDGLMLSWFANAIEVGRSAGYTAMRVKILKALDELGVPNEAYPAPVVNAEEILRDSLRLG